MPTRPPSPLPTSLRRPLAVLAIACGVGLAAVPVPTSAQPAPVADWRHPGGDPGGLRYSPLRDIGRGNVKGLEVAWTYRHGDFFLPEEGQRTRSGTAFEATPLMVEGQLILSTPYNRVISLDPETGEERWVFDPGVDPERRYVNGYVNRGVEYWRDPDPEAVGPCTSRIFVTTIDSRLIAIDARSGRPCARFGKGGTVDLHVGIERLREPEHHKMTSPAVTTRSAVVVGSSLADNRPGQPSSEIRGYDVRSGRPLWSFHVIPREGEFGAETWENESWRDGSGANAWAPLSADPERERVFVPTSTASPDYYGGTRPGDNLFSDSLLVLDARTGERAWHYQLIHHDLWDYDVASQPMLMQLPRDGAPVDVVAQLTKTGFVYVFERETGRPFHPIEERPVPRSDVPGEKASPTQPFPVRPPPLVPTGPITEAELWERSPEHLARCREMLSQVRSEGIFTPPSEQGTLVYPAPSGGADWPGGAFDPERGVLYVPSNNMVMQVIVPPIAGTAGTGGSGNPVGRAFRRLLGRGRGPEPGGAPAIVPRGGGAFMVDRWPCIRPPWGMLVAVDLARGEILWRAPAGRDHEGNPGDFHFGPALVTGGGLVFHSGTAMPELRAHDSETGEVLARFDLPASLHAGPITYKLRPEGRQYVVVTPGGHYNFARYRRGAKMGDWVIAYALPE